MPGRCKPEDVRQPAGGDAGGDAGADVARRSSGVAAARICKLHVVVGAACRRRRRCGCRASSIGRRCRRARAPPRPPRAAAAAADPCPPLRAARCRRTADRIDRRRSRKPPQRVTSCPGPRDRDRRYASTSQRSAGTSLIASTPSSSSSQNAAGMVAPPGKRQPMPTMAIGSRASRDHRHRPVHRPAAWPCPSRDERAFQELPPARDSTGIEDHRRRQAWPTRASGDFRSATASSESTPRLSKPCWRRCVGRVEPQHLDEVLAHVRLDRRAARAGRRGCQLATSSGAEPPPVPRRGQLVKQRACTR